ncbi:hypothetical protein [Uliginosibacterium sp. H1]|uniref:hypothetical protein n=1 Tax=Uliginosibacterium sp. H1 TaxID=3114757 RepID=UPI002E180ED3|nr:hypothetical protein [Uliginosibacterium sp. H1]
MRKELTKLLFSACLLGGASASQAGLLIGGDAANQASASAIVDIVFMIDTSASMSDDISAIGAAANRVVANLSCPDIDCYVRARFMGITGNSGSVFNENVRSYVLGKSGTPTSDQSEDNGWGVVDLVNYFDWGTDATATQKNYHAIVTIGDEGTENGSPVNAMDFVAAKAANEAAIAAGIFLFSWVTDDPFAGVPALFRAMAIGGDPGNGELYGSTGGAYLEGLSGVDVEARLEEIICFVAGGGEDPEEPGSVPIPSSLALVGLALFGMRRSLRSRH